MLARLGTSLPVEPIADRAELLESFDLATFGRAPARFDDAELERVNAAIVHQLPFAEVAAATSRREWTRQAGTRSGPI